MFLGDPYTYCPSVTQTRATDGLEGTKEGCVASTLTVHDSQPTLVV